MYGSRYSLSEDMQKQAGGEALEEAASKEKDVDQVVKAIAKKTNQNDHTGAAIDLAIFLKDKRTEKVLGHVSEIHRIIGSMPKQLQDFRDYMQNYMLDEIKKKYDESTYNKFKSAF